MAKKFEGISEDVSAQRKQLESELNETRKLLQQQPIIENDDNLLEEVEKKYAKQKEMISTGTLQKNKELQQLNYEKNVQQPQPQYLIKNQNDLEGLQNLEKYAGLKSDQFQTKQRQEAKKLLDDFMQPAPRQHFKKFIPRTEGMQAPNYHQFDSIGNKQQNNQMQYPYRLDNFTLSQPQGNFIKQEQKQFIISRSNSQQTFPESVDQQSSNNRVEDITVRNRGARQE
ncbi:hypothetical protein PPERSA_07792 [Pseudocohnilembus persalinus]|uniref:Uncharacterized protein n=1 Tax=Pseudocohnilembus persalinus TaxID=266149 RepID=A0A0V0QBV8_PSEPJ|nr:hypothetical protein PPERSA_07792 [Pseudocohnilembus persalinus]|eukprot:KRW99715.1 hypothetical protein PPERSA_07792 [Pseudocohnilembus persalinus]